MDTINIKNKIIWLFSVFIFLMTSPVFAEVVAEVSELKGRADVVRNNQASVSLKLGDKIESKDIIRTKNESRLLLTFVDGSQITLSEKTRLIVTDYVAKNKPRGFFELSRGKIRSFVTKTFSKRKESFQIRTKTAIAGVQGTDFEVHSFATESLVFVHEGIVSVKNVNVNIIKKQLLQAGQSAIVRAEAAPQLISVPLSSSTGTEQEDQTAVEDFSTLTSGTQQDMRSGGEIKQDPISLTPSITTRVPLPPIPNLP